MNHYAQIIKQITKHKSLLNLSKTSLSKRELNDLLDKITKHAFAGDITWGRLPIRSRNIIKKIEQQVLKNYNSYSLYPTDFQYVLLSLHVYQDDSQIGGDVTFNSAECGEYNKHLTAWNIEQIIDDEESGYYGILYINHAQQQMVLAHRGTKIEGKNKLEQLFGLFRRQDSDLQTDIKGILGKEIVGQQLIAYKAMKSAVKCALQYSYRLSTTGHSLGAWLAEMTGYYCHRDFNYSQIKIVNFDSPGSAAHMTEFDSNIKNHETELDLKNIDITTYLSPPNLVNSCNQHIGVVRQIFPDYLTLQKVEHKLDWMYQIPTIGTKIRNNSFFLNSLLSLSSHSLLGIARTFSPETGKPQKYMKVIHWPTIKYKKENSLSDTFIDTIAMTIPSSVLSMCFTKVAKGVVGRYSYNNSIFSAVHVLGHFLSGEIDMSQYFDVYKDIEHKNTPEKEYELTKNCAKSNEFSLLYKSHYQVVAEDDHSKPLNTSNKGGTDWYLSHLAKISEKKLRKTLSKISAQKAISLRKTYKIAIKSGHKHITTIHPNTVEKVSQLMQVLTSQCTRTRELLENA